jgi:hypothetical protein
MLAMTLATLGWGTWWVALFLHHVGVEIVLDVPSVVSVVFALAGLGVALLTLRARRSWIVFTLVPLFANASLLLVPWLAGELGATAP